MKKSDQHEPAKPPREANAAIHLDVAYEKRDVEVSRILILGVALALALVAAGAVVWWSFHALSAEQARSEPPPSPLRAGIPRQLPPEPRLQGAPGHETLPSEELKELEGSANAALNSYSWVDQENGIVRIPIDEAMKQLAASGLGAPQQDSGARPDAPATPPPGSPPSRKQP